MIAALTPRSMLGHVETATWFVRQGEDWIGMGRAVWFDQSGREVRRQEGPTGCVVTGVPDAWMPMMSATNGTRREP